MFNDDEDDDTTAAGDGSDSSDDSDDDNQPAPHEVEAGRGAIGELLGKLQDNGVDINSLASDAGVDTTDIDEMEHGDLIALAKHVATTHPEIAQSVLSGNPLAQGLLGRFL